MLQLLELRLEACKALDSPRVGLWLSKVMPRGSRRAKPEEKQLSLSLSRFVYESIRSGMLDLGALCPASGLRRQDPALIRRAGQKAPTATS